MDTPPLGQIPSPVVCVSGHDKVPGVTGYIAIKQLLVKKAKFTALFAFNDVSAIGAISAIREAGYRVPEDISVIGFDDIPAAAFHYPALTTIRQPLHEMGKLAAEYLLQRIANGPDAPFSEEVMVEPELIVRQSTCQVQAESATKHRRRQSINVP